MSPAAPLKASELRSEPSADDLVLEGLAHHQAGRFRDASASYERALAKSRDHADALNLAGAAAFALGDHGAAIRLIGRSVELRPDFLDAYLNLAEAQEGVGRADDAIATCRQALEREPDHVEAYLRLARLLTAKGLFASALSHGRVAEALEPDSPEASGVQAVALHRLSRFEEADARFRSALALAPEDARLLGGHADLLFEMDRQVEADSLYRQALRAGPDNADLMIRWSELLEQEGELPAALSLLEQASALLPGRADILLRRANLLRDGGRFDAAADALKTILKEEPAFSPASLSLARMRRLDLNEGRRKQLIATFSNPRLPPRYRIQAGFALGESLDNAGEPARAFQHFTAANNLYRKIRIDSGEVFDRRKLADQVRSVNDGLAADYMAATERWSNPSAAPVFVVGVARSGTTLVEQICASHSQVFGAGELWTIRRFVKAMAARNVGRGSVAKWDAEYARMLADSYVARLKQRAPKADLVVDKAPVNLLHLGLIGALLPNARVIRCRRDPLDIAVSNHTLYFDTGNLWSNDQKDALFAVKQMEALGNAWLTASRLRVLEVQYEALVSDPEPQIRRIIDFLGLGWEPACLDPQNAQRHVATPSSFQVRQPINAKSVGRWRRYEKLLGPMLAESARAD